MQHPPLTDLEKVEALRILRSPAFLRVTSLALQNMQPSSREVLAMLPHQTSAVAAQLSGASELLRRLELLVSPSNDGETVALEDSLPEWEHLDNTPAEHE